jgi:hypothetical protein
MSREAAKPYFVREGFLRTAIDNLPRGFQVDQQRAIAALGAVPD